MKSTATTPDQYIAELPQERKEVVQKLREIALSNLPIGYKEVMAYGMLGYVIPHEIYPSGYHCNTKLPLGFFFIASQKNSINLHHLGIYGDKELHDWFVTEYPKHSKLKLDMGKGCIRFKKLEEIPFNLIGQLLTKISVEMYIQMYEKALKK